MFSNEHVLSLRMNISESRFCVVQRSYVHREVECIFVGHDGTRRHRSSNHHNYNKNVCRPTSPTSTSGVGCWFSVQCQILWNVSLLINSILMKNKQTYSPTNRLVFACGGIGLSDGALATSLNISFVKGRRSTGRTPLCLGKDRRPASKEWYYRPLYL